MAYTISSTRQIEDNRIVNVQAFSLDGQYLAVGFDDGLVVVLKTVNGSQLSLYVEESTSITGLVWSNPDETAGSLLCLYVGTIGGAVYRFLKPDFKKTGSNLKTRILHFPHESVHCLSRSENGGLIVGHGKDVSVMQYSKQYDDFGQHIILQRPDPGLAPATAQRQIAPIQPAALHLYKKSAVVVTYLHHGVAASSISTQANPLWTIAPHAEIVQSAISDDGHTLAASNPDHGVDFYNLRYTKNYTKSIPPPLSASTNIVLPLVFTHSGRNMSIVMGGSSGIVDILDMTSRGVSSLAHSSDGSEHVNAVAYTKFKGTGYIATAGNQTIKIWKQTDTTGDGTQAGSAWSFIRGTIFGLILAFIVREFRSEIVGWCQDLLVSGATPTFATQTMTTGLTIYKTITQTPVPVEYTIPPPPYTSSTSAVLETSIDSPAVPTTETRSGYVGGPVRWIIQ